MSKTPGQELYVKYLESVVEESRRIYSDAGSNPALNTTLYLGKRQPKPAPGQEYPLEIRFREISVCGQLCLPGLVKIADVDKNQNIDIHLNNRFHHYPDEGQTQEEVEQIAVILKPLQPDRLSRPINRDRTPTATLLSNRAEDRDKIVEILEDRVLPVAERAILWTANNGLPYTYPNLQSESTLKSLQTSVSHL